MLLSKLLVSILEALKGEVNVFFGVFWSDRMVALWWIKEVHKWGMTSSFDIWFHVPSRSNPSDISARSISVDHLDFFHWFHSPQFLSDHQEN